MRAEVLSDSWLPPRLRCREGKVEELLMALEESREAVIVGPSGVGKSTLVRLALLEAVVVDCSVRRTAASIGRALAAGLGLKWGGLPRLKEDLAALEPRTIVFDDYTLARRTRGLLALLGAARSGHRVVLVVHPSARHAPGVRGPAVEMPPYSAEELFAIMEDRVIEGRLPASEDCLWEIARSLGYPHGPGSARLAIATLREALKLAPGEAVAEHAKTALALLHL